MCQPFLVGLALSCAGVLTVSAQSAAGASGNGLDSLDPGEDGWSSESFTSAAETQLETLGAWLTTPAERMDLEKSIRENVLALEGAFRGGRLAPAKLVTDFEDDRVTVRRSVAGTEKTAVSDLIAALRALTRNLTGAAAERFALKTVDVNVEEGKAAHTRHLVTVFGKTKTGLQEQNAVWLAHWNRGAEGEPPRLRGIDLEAFEEVETRLVSPEGGSALFSECTPAVLGGNEAYRQQFLHSTDYWRRRIENYHNIHIFGQRGMALGDVDGDGLDDVYLCQPGGLPNRLFLHRKSGRATDISAAAGVDLLDSTRAALFIDLDNDGDQDLVAALSSGVVFFENTHAASGRVLFRKQAVFDRLADGQSMVAADYDHDGDLDIYLCSYYADARNAGELALPLPYFDANNGGRNFLLRNEGGWKFTDATAETGLDANNGRWSWAAVWFDYDNDGFQDLYVANDFGKNNLYANTAGSKGKRVFKDVTAVAGLEDGAFGMSACAGDFDRDGATDLYVGNMFSSAGSRITRQPEFQPGIDGQTRMRFQRLARGNSLFRNRQAEKPGAGFEDVSEFAGVTQGRWSWSSLFADFNNDGWEDIVVTNGYVSGEKSSDDL